MIQSKVVNQGFEMARKKRGDLPDFKLRRLNRIKKKETRSYRYLRKISFEGRGPPKKRIKVLRR